MQVRKISNQKIKLFKNFILSSLSKLVILKRKKNYPLFKPKEHNFKEIYWCAAVPLFVTQHTQPLSLEQVLLTHVAHSEAAVWTQVAAVEEQSQLRVTPRTYLGEVVSRSEHALHPDCLDLRLELAVHGARKINIHIKFFCETSVYKMVHMSKRINKMQHNLFLVYIVNFVDF